MVRPQFPDYGVFLQWPYAGTDWIHPEDVAAAERLIPSNRVFRRVAFEPPYYHYWYGDTRLRLKPAMWLAVAGEGFDVGDPVETIGLGKEEELFIGEIIERRYDRRRQTIYYRLRRGNQRLPRRFAAKNLRLLIEKVELRPAEQITIEPAEEKTIDPAMRIDPPST